MDIYTFSVRAKVISISNPCKIGFSTETSQDGHGLIIEDANGINYFPSIIGAVLPELGKTYDFTIEVNFLMSVVSFMAV